MLGKKNRYGTIEEVDFKRCTVILDGAEGGNVWFFDKKDESLTPVSFDEVPELIEFLQQFENK